MAPKIAPAVLSLLLTGCASAPPAAPRAPATAATAAADTPDPPPAGSKRLPSSIDCEPEPPLICQPPDCVSATGEAGRRIGSLDKEVIRAVIRAHLAEVRACYDAIAFTQTDAKGTMRVKLGIGPSGAVQTSCLVSSELGAASVDACVLERVLTWRFPAPDGGGWVIVTYPFVFTR